MKKAFPIALMVLGLVFLGAAGYTANKGFDAKDQVRNELLAQNITTPEDASIPNARVDDPKTAQAMADIIQVHALEATGGKTYAGIAVGGRYVALTSVCFARSLSETAYTGCAHSAHTVFGLAV